MANRNMFRNSCNQNKNTKVCSINIGGLSSKARFQLDKYVNDENVGILAVQENGPHALNKMQLKNMKIIQDHKQKVRLQKWHEKQKNFFFLFSLKTDFFQTFEP